MAERHFLYSFERHFSSNNKKAFSYPFLNNYFVYCGLSSVLGGGVIIRTQGTQALCSGDPAVAVWSSQLCCTRLFGALHKDPTPIWWGPPDLISMTQMTCVNLIWMNIYDFEGRNRQDRLYLESRTPCWARLWNFELYGQYLWKWHISWKTRTPPQPWKSPRVCI